MNSITVEAPAKAILLGEHSVNRGQMALAVSVGLYARCSITKGKAGRYRYAFEGGGQTQEVSRGDVVRLAEQIEAYRAANDYTAIQQLAREDFFAPTKYVLAAVVDHLPSNLHISFSSEIPASSGLGSGGATFAALAVAMARLLNLDAPAKSIAAWAQRGDIIAHGGIASGLDTQTSLYGGAIRYTTEKQGEPVQIANGLKLVIGNSGVYAATSEVNGRVREWLAENPERIHYFQEIGLLAHQAEIALRDGNWQELGRLLNLNQLLLEQIGVSCPELETLNKAALAAGALGAKLSGSGGGGIMIALVTAETEEQVAQTIRAAGGTPIIAQIGVKGAFRTGDDDEEE